jgi:putative endonuclease
MWHVYILECADGSLYTGVTTDLKRHLKEHREFRWNSGEFRDGNSGDTILNSVS